jgi:hypothetical protein
MTHVILVPAEGLWHLGSLFHQDTQYSQWGWFTNFLWCDIHETRHYAQAHVTPGALILYTVPFLFQWEEHRQEQSWVDDFAGQCCLWRLSSRTTFVVATHGIPTHLGLRQSLLFPASSFKFLTRRSLKSWWVYFAPHEDKSIQLLSTVRSRRLK